MAHPQQNIFCESVKQRFPHYFSGVLALDIGSLDINGNNQYLFDKQSIYLGADVAEGRNVDIVTVAHEIEMPRETFDVIVSTECLEHDRYWDRTLRRAVDMLRPGGMLLVTCATTGRAEHGTRRTTPHDAPLLIDIDGKWADYYRNLTEHDFRDALNLDDSFRTVEFSIGEETHDLYFFAIKHGEFKARNDRSINLPSHPARAHEADLCKQLVLAQCELHRVQADNAQARSTLAAIYASKSWRMTRPLRKARSGMARLGCFTRRAKNAMSYFLRGDIDGLLQRQKLIRRDAALSRVAESPPGHWGIMTTPHTLFIAHLIEERLRTHGWRVDVMTCAPANFPHDMYVVICAQMFDKLPPDEKRIVYQMEQSVSSRWFTKRYLELLMNSVAVLDYALANIEFMVDKGVSYPQVYYLPVGATREYMPEAPSESVEKDCDILFYGDAKSSPRRRRLLETLQQNFDVRVCREVYGADMAREIRKARIVINIHYYENALLETTRIQECLSLGVPVVSESSQDQSDYPELNEAVTYFREGDAQDMIAVVRAVLGNTPETMDVARSVELSRRRFTFMFDRFLVARNLLAADKLSDGPLPIPAHMDRIALSMPETIERRRVFEANRPLDCTVFDGVRASPGWVGCGLSYAHLARHAMRNRIQRLTVLEDDALLPADFENKMRTVHAYLDNKAGQWDVFVGLIADLHSNVQVLDVETFRGMRFATIDKMVSTVCNIYGKRALQLLSSWNSNHRDPSTNTIDRFLERQPELRVVVALPFLTGHREALHSTIWGISNEKYNDMIANSERALMAKVDAYTSRDALTS